MTTVRVGCITNSTQNIRYRKEEHFLKFNPQKWQITKSVKEKKGKKKKHPKYVLAEICAFFKIPLVLPTLDVKINKNKIKTTKLL